MRPKKLQKPQFRLRKQPEIGQVEELLKGRSQKFHYLIHQSYKIIYWINWDSNQVEIVDVFQTNQYPEKIKRTK
jgi:mRNA-degrading endonuclease RelE of RelBE toxin-antitoxin system